MILLRGYDLALHGMVALTLVAAIPATVGLLADVAAGGRTTRLSRLQAGVWVALPAAVFCGLLLRIPDAWRPLMNRMNRWPHEPVRVPHQLVEVVFHAALVSLCALAVLGAIGLIASYRRRVGGERNRRLRGTSLAALATVVLSVGPFLAPHLFQTARAAWWRHRAPETPYGRIERVEMRLDFEYAGYSPPEVGEQKRLSLAVWDDPLVVKQLVRYVPWTERGPGYGFRCQEGSPFHLVFVAGEGTELVVILACDDCGTSGPAWDRSVGWHTPELLTLVGELLVREPAAQEYAGRFDGRVREYAARWLYWAKDPFHVH